VCINNKFKKINNAPKTEGSEVKDFTPLPDSLSISLFCLEIKNSKKSGINSCMLPIDKYIKITFFTNRFEITKFPLRIAEYVKKIVATLAINTTCALVNESS
jgi:hypothetical protein